MAVKKSGFRIKTLISLELLTRTKVENVPGYLLKLPIFVIQKATSHHTKKWGRNLPEVMFMWWWRWVALVVGGGGALMGA